MSFLAEKNLRWIFAYRWFTGDRFFCNDTYAGVRELDWAEGDIEL